jgi:IS5 family transposase
MPHHGYKGHIAADLWGIVTDSRVGTPTEHDSNTIDELTERERHLMLADSASSDRSRREALRSRGVIDGICSKPNRGQTNLDPWQERWSRLVSKGRAKVEHPTALLKQQLGCRRARCPRRERNALDSVLSLTACNIMRSLSLRARVPRGIPCFTTP